MRMVFAPGAFPLVVAHREQRNFPYASTARLHLPSAHFATFYVGKRRDTNIAAQTEAVVRGFGKFAVRVYSTLDVARAFTGIGSWMHLSPALTPWRRRHAHEGG